MRMTPSIDLDGGESRKNSPPAALKKKMTADFATLTALSAISILLPLATTFTEGKNP
jgi:hypothetical protein